MCTRPTRRARKNESCWKGSCNGTFAGLVFVVLLISVAFSDHISSAMNDSNDDINSIRDESQKKGSNRLNGARDEIDRSVLLSLAAEQMPPPKASPRGKPMSVMRLILGECMCEPFPFSDNRGLSQTSQFVELHGVECISLGAVIDELSPDQRIRETLEQLTAAPKRMISIGYLVDEENPVRASGNQVAVNESANSNKITETVDLDVWRKNYPDDKNMSKPVAHIIKLIEVRYHC